MDTTLIVLTIDKRQRIPMEVIHSLAERIAAQFQSPENYPVWLLCL